jgi:hypothetical protein
LIFAIGQDSLCGDALLLQLRRSHNLRCELLDFTGQIGVIFDFKARRNSMVNHMRLLLRRPEHHSGALVGAMQMNAETALLAVRT